MLRRVRVGAAMSRLTGRFNFRKTWRGRLSLDVEEEYQSHWGGEKRRWRKANLADLAEPGMRALVDLRFQRQSRGRVADPIQASDPPSPGPTLLKVVPNVEHEKQTTGH